MSRALSAVALIVLVAYGAPALADDDRGPKVTKDTSHLLVTWEDTAEGHVQAGAPGSADPIVQTWEEPNCALGGSETCLEPASCSDGSPMATVSGLTASGHAVDLGTSCPVEGRPAQAPVVTPGLVLRALRAIYLPAAELSVQPPNGRTLVNFDTNFFTEQGAFTRVVTLLGQRVELRIRPAGFTWRFGDGASRESTSPGARYPDLEITHSYERTGRVAPSVDVTYAARFRVAGGPWRDVVGTVTIPGDPQALRVVEARPVLVGG